MTGRARAVKEYRLRARVSRPAIALCAGMPKRAVAGGLAWGPLDLVEGRRAGFQGVHLLASSRLRSAWPIGRALTRPRWCQACAKAWRSADRAPRQGAGARVAAGLAWGVWGDAPRGGGAAERVGGRAFGVGSRGRRGFRRRDRSSSLAAGEWPGATAMTPKDFGASLTRRSRACVGWSNAGVRGLFELERQVLPTHVECARGRSEGRGQRGLGERHELASERSPAGRPAESASGQGALSGRQLAAVPRSARAQGAQGRRVDLRHRRASLASVHHVLVVGGLRRGRKPEGEGDPLAVAELARSLLALARVASARSARRAGAGSGPSLLLVGTGQRARAPRSEACSLSSAGGMPRARVPQLDARVDARGPGLTSSCSRAGCSRGRCLRSNRKARCRRRSTCCSRHGPRGRGSGSHTCV